MTHVQLTHDTEEQGFDFPNPKAARTFIRSTLKIKSVKAEEVQYDKEAGIYAVACTEEQFNLAEEYLERKQERTLNKAIKDQDLDTLQSFTVTRLKVALRDREVFPPSSLKKAEIIEWLINPPAPEEEPKAEAPADADADTEADAE